MPPNRRIAVTITDRIALRQRYFDTPGIIQSHQDLIDWFQQRYGRQLSQSIVSRTISDTYKYLDDNNTTIPGQIRRVQGKWPHLEQALSEWQQYVQNNKHLSQTQSFYHKLSVFGIEWMNIKICHGLDSLLDGLETLTNAIIFATIDNTVKLDL
jgi:hypothetical protein